MTTVSSLGPNVTKRSGTHARVGTEIRRLSIGEKNPCKSLLIPIRIPSEIPIKTPRA
jgi:hypothetical protein